MAEALYSLDILRLAASIAGWPMQSAADGHAERRSATCGSRVAVAVSLDAAGAVGAIGLDLNACALGQASAALMAEHAPGRTAPELRAAAHALRAWLGGERDDPPGWPGVEVLGAARAYPARHPSILLSFEAAADAIDLAAARRGNA